MSESRRVKIIHLLKTLDIGGVERSTINYSNEIVKKGFWVGIFVPKGLYSYENIIDERINLFHPTTDISRNFIAVIKIFKFLNRILKDEQISIIHYHQRIFIPVILLIKLSRIKVAIIYTHHSVYNDFVNFLILADKVVALNKQTLRDLPNRLQKQANVIHHGVKVPENFVRQRNSFLKIGYVGRFVEWKGIEVLIEAFAMVEAIIPNVKLLLKGNGPLKVQIIDIICALNLLEKVEIENPKTSLDKIYSDIDLLVLPSEKLEGFGLVVIEAMAYKIPVIASNIPTFSEIIKHKFNGLLSEPQNREDLSDCIISLLKNKLLFNSIVENGLLIVKNNFNIRDTITNYEKLYSNLF